MDYIARLGRRILEARQEKNEPKGQAVQGRIIGGMVDINGMKYPYEAVTDVLEVDGAPVWCQMSKDGEKAVIIGA